MADSANLSQTLRGSEWRWRDPICVKRLPQAPKGFPLRKLAGALRYGKFQSKHCSATEAFRGVVPHMLAIEAYR
jgi:hypothetical protein